MHDQTDSLYVEEDEIKLLDLLIVLAIWFNFPLAVALPALLSLPLGLFQIWYLNRIAVGAKPNWTLMGVLAVFVFGVTAYLLAFSFWTR